MLWSATRTLKRSRVPVLQKHKHLVKWLNWSFISLKSISDRHRVRRIIVTLVRIVLDNKRELSEAEVVDLARARVKLRARKTSVSSEAHTKELAAINLLLDQGHSVEARTRLTTLISDCRNDPVTLANARLALSIALEMHGDYQKSLQSLGMYEAEDADTNLPAEVALKLRVQIAIGWNYCGDHPRAVASLQAALKESSDEQAA